MSASFYLDTIVERVRDMTVGELIVKLIECGNLDAEVYLMSAGNVVEIENDLGIQVYFHGDVPVPEENLVGPEGKSDG